MGLFKHTDKQLSFTRKAFRVMLILLVSSITWISIVKEQEEEKARALYDRGKRMYENAKKQDSVSVIGRDARKTEEKNIQK